MEATRARGASTTCGDVRRYGVSVPVSRALSNDWSLTVAPSVDWFGEKVPATASPGSGAPWCRGETVWAATAWEWAWGVRPDREDQRLPGGDRGLAPERPLALGQSAAQQSGLAGLELDYRFDGDWTAGVGVAYRSVRFRLNDRASAPGVGESGVPLFLRVTLEANGAAPGGAVVGGKLGWKMPPAI